jgi:S-adenosylmethionine:tRNA ribosyltransferase-isomerase
MGESTLTFITGRVQCAVFPFVVGKAISSQGTEGAQAFSRQDFHFDLPDRLIASAPQPVRDQSRLLQVTSERLIDRRFDQLAELLMPGDLLVVNDTRVVKARLNASKDSGGRAELLLERLEDEHRALFQVRVSKALKPGRRLLLSDSVSLTVLERVGDFYRLEAERPIMALLEQFGSVPLPPYIAREADAADAERYQTVYSRTPGAAAAPTAGLHFTPELLSRLEAGGVEIAELTLHVGAGTFQPVRSEDLAGHNMHSERYFVPPETATKIAATRDRGGRVVAVGTTVVRALESACLEDRVRTGWRETSIFITPGYEFAVVDALITNFHLPESTLLMLVCAFAGYEQVMSAYRYAVANEYRFFSYGDAMFLERADGN